MSGKVYVKCWRLARLACYYEKRQCEWFRSVVANHRVADRCRSM